MDYHLDDDDTHSNGTSDEVTNAISMLSDEEGKEFEEFRKSMSIVGSFTKRMVRLAIEELRPEFERMAGAAADKALESKLHQVKDLQNELNSKERELKQLKLEKKILQAKLEKEKINKDVAEMVDAKERNIKRLETDIACLQGKLRRKAEELKKEKDRATAEETKRVELETTLSTEIDRLKKELDRVKGHLGQLRSAKNVGDEETKKLRDRERLLLDEIEDLRRQQPKLRRKLVVR